RLRVIGISCVVGGVGFQIPADFLTIFRCDPGGKIQWACRLAIQSDEEMSWIRKAQIQLEAHLDSELSFSFFSSSQMALMPMFKAIFNRTTEVATATTGRAVPLMPNPATKPRDTFTASLLGRSRHLCHCL